MLSVNDKTSTVIQALIIQDVAFNTVHAWVYVVERATIQRHHRQPLRVVFQELSVPITSRFELQ